jgi:hypothetical protein
LKFAAEQAKSTETVRLALTPLVFGAEVARRVFVLVFEDITGRPKAAWLGNCMQLALSVLHALPSFPIRTSDLNSRWIGVIEQGSCLKPN